MYSNLDQEIEIDFKPASRDVLFHYCSISTLISIIQHRKLWLSDINTMNDFGEMHWAYERFEEAADNVMSRVGRSFLDAIDLVISTGQLRILPMLGCFSTDGDVLSQWRAYSDDGAGVSIGFDAKKIKSLSVRIGPVEYEKERQVRYFETWLLSLHEATADCGENEKNKMIVDAATRLSIDMIFFKNPGFSEEKEVRIARAVNVSKLGDEWRLTDPGGFGERVSRKKLEVKYRSASNGGIVSYVELPLVGLGNDLVKEVVVGPKSPNNGREISMALTAAGFNGFKITHSETTYR